MHNSKLGQAGLEQSIFKLKALLIKKLVVTMATVFDFLPEIVGSLIGVFLGFVLGISLERKMRKEESKEKKRFYLSAIINEVQNNKNIIDKSAAITMRLQDGSFVSYHGEHLPTESLVSGIYSGEFRSISVKTQTRLTQYLQYCNYVNSTIDTLNFASPSVIHATNSARQNHHYFNILRNFIPHLIKDLQEEDH